jgi:hypothetical protein
MNLLAPHEMAENIKCQPGIADIHRYSLQLFIARGCHTILNYTGIGLADIPPSFDFFW